MAARCAGGVKRRYESLVTAFGDEKARLIASETEAAFDFFEERVATLKLRTDYARCGTFVGAHSRAAFDTLKRTADDATGELADNYEIIEKADIDREIQTDIYHGGMVIKRAGGVQPARYHTALATACDSAGAALFEYTRATQIVQKADKSFSVTIASATGAQQDRRINANEVIVATNGYSTKSDALACQSRDPGEEFHHCDPTGRQQHGARSDSEPAHDLRYQACAVLLSSLAGR